MSDRAHPLLPTLIVLEGEDLGRTWSVRPGGAVIGRGLGADITVADPKASRQHARLEWSEGPGGAPPGVVLVDLGSTNGTRVNGVVVADRVGLSEHDRVQIGSTMLALTFQDGGEVLRQREERERATTDPVTGVANADAFGSVLAREFARARRYERPLSVVALDLDRLGGIEDAHGARVAAAVLAHVGRVLRDSLRRSDLAGRAGPSGFTLLLTDTAEVGAKLVAERIRRAIAAFPTVVGEASIALTASAGVATLVADHASESALLESATHACFRARAGGIDRVVVAGGES